MTWTVVSRSTIFNRSATGRQPFLLISGIQFPLQLLLLLQLRSKPQQATATESVQQTRCRIRSPDSNGVSLREVEGKEPVFVGKAESIYMPYLIVMAPMCVRGWHPVSIYNRMTPPLLFLGMSTTIVAHTTGLSLAGPRTAPGQFKTKYMEYAYHCPWSWPALWCPGNDVDLIYPQKHLSYSDGS
ncbi:hypothetical protein F5Y04DRAFT_46592 [Hypomontagnella monticulosa]|nr:hypothetical protein F5Y04DRAFT_46592 [Hypomontagnella monticulosa]